MVYVEIEIGEWAGDPGSWGCNIHYYNVKDGCIEYDCDSGEFGRCDSPKEARWLAEDKLDELYGVGGWKHI